MPMKSLGQLEQSIMDLLWLRNEPLTAYEVRDELLGAAESDIEGSVSGLGSEGTGYAVTTVLTVLSRLTKKGFVAKNTSQRPHLFSATSSREEHTAELLHQVLSDVPDRQAVLAEFVGGIGPEEADALRTLLNKPRSS